MMRAVVVTTVLVALGPVAVAAQAPTPPRCGVDWSLTETLRIGSLDGDDALSWFSSVAIGDDGEIYIPQPMLGSVLVFSPEGELIRELGREGSGPGDFEAGPRVVSWVDGELWVADRLRAQSFGADGTPRDFVSFQSWIASEGSTFRPEAPLPDGHFWARRSVSPIRDANAQPTTLAIRRWDRDGGITDTIAVLDVRNSRVVVNPESGGFADHPLWSMLPGGGLGRLRALLAPDRASLVLLGEVQEENGTFDLLRITTDGDTLLNRSLSYVPRVISRPERDWWFKEFSAVIAGDSSVGRPGFRQTTEAQRNRERARARDAFSLPAFYPPVRQILAGRDGTIWLLREPNVLEAEDRWEVYDTGGALIGRIVDANGRARFTPWLPRLQLLRASAEEVWASSMDDFDTPYLHRFRVDRECAG